MSTRELVVLGTSSAVPTKRRNHNGYLLRWDAHGILFDPGEGTQRQMRYAGLSAHDVTRICVTHFHGDHCLGLPGVVQRIARDRVRHPVRVAFPAAGRRYWERLRLASEFARPGAFGRGDVLVAQPVEGARARLDGEDDLTVTALPLDHSVPTYGYRVAEPDGVRMLADRLAERGVRGPDVGRLKAEGSIVDASGARLELADYSEVRRGQVFAFVMDTGVCDNAVRLAEGADLLVIESTYLDAEAALAAEYRHLTAGQAGRIAAEAGVRTLVLTHISERYGTDDDPRFAAEAARYFDGDIVLAADLDRIAVPPRRA
ncbi:ribonuclease Z [Marinitenerispora sediminis]|uniref:Ribonuclease Z n=1 Tax=Marinitenerispora sediminis TaxID=1931232 RepID=A0A368T1X6_9ACTN|nr:ribonuclease Z [Marinitenerispora sediminis]RCV54844.1 ribonuclease Z [Marinitenerispora sediminis]RCV55080.1 ribonuclease Z [Marinitenerispora sediminis]RCV56252.1 ribonuclease Z [Marinitenerispora sediminis]